MTPWPLGVFASVDAGLGVHLDVVRELGVPTAHLHSPHPESRTAERGREFKRELAALPLEVTCVFAGFEGESYADIPTVAKTVGLIPLATRGKRTEELLEIAEFAGLLGVKSVGVHIGFVPHEVAAVDYSDVVRIARRVCDQLAQNGQALHLETGQEPAEVLLRFLDDVGCDNLYVNFDPANMILYGCGEPIDALRQLGGRVRSVHCKDATWSSHPGETWGAEVPVGSGDVDFRRFLQTLADIGYQGPLTIEREIPQDRSRQAAEIASAIGVLTELKRTILG